MPAVLWLPGAVRAVAVPLRAALHALLRAQAAPLHHVAEGHEAPESSESISLQRLSFWRKKGLLDDDNSLEVIQIQIFSKCSINFYATTIKPQFEIF